MGTLKDILINEARAKDICQPGYEKMRTEDIDGLIDYYMTNPDWCLERGFPDLQLLTKYFSDCENKGVFVNKTFHGEEFMDLQTYVFHNCKGSIKVAMNYDKAIIPMLYFANGCDLVVSCTQQNTPSIRVPIYLFGGNNVVANNSDNASFRYYYCDLK